MLKKILVGLLVLTIVAIVGIIALIAVDVLSGAQAVDVTNTEFTSADATLYGYMAQPDAEGVFPAVIMIHEWWGLTAELTEMADTLAEQGYIVFAPDTYRGRVADTVPGALYLRLTISEEQATLDVQAAYAYLASLPSVDVNRIGILGFCYGGGVALRHAVSNGDIAATINLYGDTIVDAAEFGSLADSERPLLGIFGAEDNQIPVSSVNAFEAALTEAGIPHEITIYPGVGHAFVNPTSIQQPGAAQDAWAQILTFLEANVQNRAA